MSNALEIVTTDVYSVRDQFDKMSGGALNFEREAGFAVQVLSNNDYALKIGSSNRNSVINAVANVAAIGISLNPAKRQAYLVPRDGRICLDISYMGLLDLAIQSGSILWGQAEVVYEADTFELQGFDKPPTHNRNPFSTDRGQPIGAYVVVKTRDSDYLTTAMSIAEIFDIRNRSAAWKAWVDKKRKCPWVTDEGEMIKKTVIKRAYKLWPKTDRLDKAVHYLNTDGGEGIDFEKPEADDAIIITPRGEPMAEMSIEVQEYLRDLAMDVIAIFNEAESGTPIAFDRLEAENLDSEQKVALWDLLPSNVRSAIKKEGEYRRNKQKESA